MKYLIWKDEFIKGLWNVSSFANDEKEMKIVYNKLIEIYEGCYSYHDFFKRTKDMIKPAKYISDAFFNRHLSKIVNAVWNSLKNGNRCRIWCYQQAILMAAGIKAMNSYWNKEFKKFISEDEFKFKFWVGRKERSHVELVIYKWRGEDLNPPIAMDTHLEEKPYKWNKKARYINSIMWNMVHMD